MGDAALTAALARSNPAGISSYLLAGIWGLEMVHLFFPLPELRWAGSVALVLFIGLALVRASRHIRILCLTLTAVSALLADKEIYDALTGSEPLRCRASV